MHQAIINTNLFIFNLKMVVKIYQDNFFTHVTTWYSSKIDGSIVHSTFTSVFIRVFSVPHIGGNGKIFPTLPEKLACCPHPTLFCPRNVDFVFFMQILAILPKIFPQPTNRPHLGYHVVTLLFVLYIN